MTQTPTAHTAPAQVCSVNKPLQSSRGPTSRVLVAQPAMCASQPYAQPSGAHLVSGLVWSKAWQFSQGIVSGSSSLSKLLSSPQISSAGSSLVAHSPLKTTSEQYSRSPGVRSSASAKSQGSSATPALHAHALETRGGEEKSNATADHAASGLRQPRSAAISLLMTLEELTSKK
jgi:hypothetical protein